MARTPYLLVLLTRAMTTQYAFPQGRGAVEARYSHTRRTVARLRGQLAWP